MGAALCARDGKAPALVLETTVDVAQLAGRRDLCEGQGQMVYFYRAVDKRGDTIDFYLSPTRNAKAAKSVLGKALAGLKGWEKPETINTDKAQAYGIAITELKAEGKCPPETRHRQVKYLNNIVEADHGKMKQLIKPALGFKSMKTAYATLKGFEVMNALRKGQAVLWRYNDGVMGEVRLLNRQFSIYSI
jgi:transposase-like protein